MINVTDPFMSVKLTGPHLMDKYLYSLLSSP